MNPLLLLAARLLPEQDRDIILGDLIESGENPARSVLAILGLVSRRHLQLWRDWRPWIAAGSALAASLLLLGASFGLSLRAHSAPSLTSAILHPAILLILWSWTAGCMITTLARRTWPICALLCLIPCLSCTLRFHVPSLSPFSVLLFLVPGLHGALAGAPRLRPTLPPAIAVAVASTALTLVWSEASPWPLLLTLPSWFFVISANLRSRGHEVSPA
jgi:hypothetical protein